MNEHLLGPDTPDILTAVRDILTVAGQHSNRLDKDAVAHGLQSHSSNECQWVRRQCDVTDTSRRGVYLLADIDVEVEDRAPIDPELEHIAHTRVQRAAWGLLKGFGTDIHSRVQFSDISQISFDFGFIYLISRSIRFIVHFHRPESEILTNVMKKAFSFSYSCA